MAISYKQQAGVPHGFIRQYMDSMAETETAHAYDFWCAVWALGAALGREVYVDRPGAPVYSNWYVIFVANSGVTRKSTAIRAITRVTKEVIGDDAEWFEGRTTPEALELRLHERSINKGNASAIINISELVTFLGRERYNMAMPGLLTDLYDSVDQRLSGGGVTRGPTEMRGVYVSFLSASTPSWLASAINPDVIEGGFTSRCIFVHEEQAKGKIPWSSRRTTESTQIQMANCLGTVTKKATRQKAFGLTDAAKKRYTSWYKSRPRSRSPYGQSFESREADHVLRLALCLAVNDESDVIRSPHVSRAVRVIGYEKARASRLFEGGVVPDKVALGVDRILGTLVSHGATGIPHSRLYMKVRHLMSATEFNAALDIMHELQMVDRFSDTRSGKGRKADIWRGTSNIHDIRLKDNVMVEMEPT